MIIMSFSVVKLIAFRCWLTCSYFCFALFLCLKQKIIEGHVMRTKHFLYLSFEPKSPIIRLIACSHNIYYIAEGSVSQINCGFGSKFYFWQLLTSKLYLSLMLSSLSCGIKKCYQHVFVIANCGMAPGIIAWLQNPGLFSSLLNIQQYLQEDRVS